MLHSIAAAAIPLLGSAQPQHLANMAWACARLQFRHKPLLAAISAASVATITQFSGQEIANTLWSFAKLRNNHAPLLSAISRSAVRKIGDFKAQELSNTAWSLATISYSDAPLLEAIAAAAIPKISSFSMQNLASTAWAFAELQVAHAPLLTAISAAAQPPNAAGPAQEIAMLACSFARLNLPQASLTLLRGAWDAGIELSPLAWSSLLAEAEVQQSMPVRVELALRLRSHGASLAGNLAAIHAAEAGDISRALEILTQSPWDNLSKRLWIAFGGEATFPASALKATVFAGKELQLYSHALGCQGGCATEVAAVVEAFGLATKSTGGWLKVAGAEKTDLLTKLAATRVPKFGRVLEIGTYCGYSALRLATAMPTAKITTIDTDPLASAVARCLLAFGGLLHRVDCRTGHSKDLIPRLARECARPFDLVFMDQSGSRFLDDMDMMDALGLIRCHSVVVADNVLKPGAPQFLWRLFTSKRYAATTVQVDEFAMDAEDWMVIATIQAAPHVASSIPEAIEELQWQADYFRARACRQGAGGVSHASWAAHAARMKRSFAAIGIQPSMSMRT